MSKTFSEDRQRVVDRLNSLAPVQPYIIQATLNVLDSVALADSKRPEFDTRKELIAWVLQEHEPISRYLLALADDPEGHSVERMVLEDVVRKHQHPDTEVDYGARRRWVAETIRANMDLDCLRRSAFACMGIDRVAEGVRAYDWLGLTEIHVSDLNTLAQADAEDEDYIEYLESLDVPNG